MNIILKTWNDPVWSKVIAVIIITTGSIIAGLFTYDNWQLVFNYVKQTVELDRWLFITMFLFIIFLLIINTYLFIKVRKYKTNEPEINNELSGKDIAALIDSWWPEPEGQFPKDVHVDFKSLEHHLKLPRGSVNQHIDAVARKNCFNPKHRGDNHAIFSYDLAKAMNDVDNLNDYH